MSYARVLAFDVEAVATFNAGIRRRVMQEAMEKRPAKNAAKELKVDWDREESRQARATEAVEKTAVNVLLAEPVCVCWAAWGEEPLHEAMEEVMVCDCMDRSGKHLESQRAAMQALAQTWDEVAGPETIWVGHNIIGYDLPVLTNAWLRLGIKRPAHFPEYVGGRWRGRVFDTMQRAALGSGPNFVGLDALCEALGVPMTQGVEWQGEEVDGSKVGAMFAAGDYDAIVAYGRGDIPPLLGLYGRITEGDTRATYDRGSGVAVQLEELREAEGLTEGQRMVAVWSALEGAGLVKRAA